jgi:hypothetical protein
MNYPQPLATLRTQATIEALYGHSAAAPPPIIEGCPCCIATRGVDVLLSTPLRQLTGQALWRYVSGVFYTIGSENDFLYLLPRIIEISALDPDNANYPGIVIGKLRLANWQSWTASQQQTIEDFLDAWFELELARDLEEGTDGPIGWQAESVLCGAAKADFPLDRWLARLSEPSAAPVLADLQCRFPAELSSFWEDAPEGLRALSLILSKGRA